MHCTSCSYPCKRLLAIKSFILIISTAAIAVEECDDVYSSLHTKADLLKKQADALEYGATTALYRGSISRDDGTKSNNTNIKMNAHTMDSARTSTIDAIIHSYNSILTSAASTSRGTISISEDFHCFAATSKIEVDQRQVLRDKVGALSFAPVTELESCSHDPRVRFLNTKYLPKVDTCSLVSSGRTAARSKWGSEIDASSLVARCNDAVTDGFEDHVGSRTDFMVINDLMVVNHGCDNMKLSVVPKYILVVDFGQAFVDCNCIASMMQKYKDTTFFTFNYTTFAHEVEPILQEIVNNYHVETNKKVPHPSSGLIAGLFLQQMCTETSFYGFLPLGIEDDYCQEHYWDDESNFDLKRAPPCTLTDFHSLCAEKFFWAMLLDRNTYASGKGTLAASKGAKRNRDSKARRMILAGVQSSPDSQLLATSSQSTIDALTWAHSIAACFPLGLVYLIAVWRHNGVLNLLGSRLTKDQQQRNCAAALLTYLALLVSLDIIIKMDAEEGHGQYGTPPFVMVPLVEAGKLFASLLILLVTTSCFSIPAHAEKHEAAFGADTRPANWKVALFMLPVAVTYIMNSFLVFAVLASVNMNVYAVWRNISILFNAILWVFIMNKNLPLHCWVAIGICMMACCLSSLHLDGRIVVDANVALIILSAFLSSIASVYNEYVIKAQGFADVGLDRLNIMLYGLNLGLMAVCFAIWASFEVCNGQADSVYTAIDRYKTLTPGGLRIILIQVVLGLSVSRVLKYSNSVSKTVTSSLRDVAVVLVAPSFVSGTRLDWVTGTSAAWMALSAVIYFSPVQQTDESHINDSC